ncbi:serine-protein kinase RsbW [Roseivivax jejudonensis]|uniref:Serine-protein kinase RsbW n=1 Tax=Roseivivax jejudonensis TaxID=1529041 RepID=A0A1X6ZRH4_9RHOB|nr:ATP-binding protein [Roseivivax jejudonensis]SLN59154.1 serine-protein kinase RsbW [Roseivivax jejudonensis]
MPADEPSSGRAGAAVGDAATTLHLHATPVDIRSALLRFEADLRVAGLNAAQAGLSALVVGEALNNVAEHALRGCPAGRIEVRAILEPGHLSVLVEDQGAPMPGLALPRGDLPDLSRDLSDLPEGGFGWHLIRALTHSLDYSRTHGRNRLRMRIMLDRLHDGVV